MSEVGAKPARVGVRELRQNLSIYLDRVKAGETLEVTEHGHTVAQLTPLPDAHASALDRMIAEGRAWPASETFADFAAPSDAILPAGSPSLSETLLQMREEER